MPGGKIEVLGVPGMPRVGAGDDVGRLVAECAKRAGAPVKALDIVVVAQKIVSKSEGRTVRLADVTPGAEAMRLAVEADKDPRLVEVVLSESVRVVRAVRGVLIVETRPGFICANAGVDASNVPGDDVVTLLPEDADASARRIRARLVEAAHGPVAVVVSDTFNRPWREGSINVAIGVSGFAPLLDQRGQSDDYGRTLRVTIVSLADEVCSAAQLVMGEARGTPAAVVRGVAYEAGEGAAASLLRPAARDLFR